MKIRSHTCVSLLSAMTTFLDYLRKDIYNNIISKNSIVLTCSQTLMMKRQLICIFYCIYMRSFHITDLSPPPLITSFDSPSHTCIRRSFCPCQEMSNTNITILSQIEINLTRTTTDEQTDGRVELNWSLNNIHNHAICSIIRKHSALNSFVLLMPTSSKR